VNIAAVCLLYVAVRITIDAFVSPLDEVRPWYFGYFAFAVTPLLTMLPILFSPQHQSLHDQLLQTIVRDENDRDL
jgi:hypothetical protein